MEVRIKDNNGYVDADWTIEDGVMIVSPKVEKFVPKDGDVVTVTTEAVGNYTCFFKGYVNGDVYSYGGLNNLYNMLFGDRLVCCSKKLKTIYPATEEEKKKLFDKLAEEGYKFDFEKKELVKLKWKPNNGDVYWCPSASIAHFKPLYSIWRKSVLDLDRFESGLSFKTEEECQAFCDRLNEAINKVTP